MNYVNDRTKLSYAVLKDRECGEILVVTFNCNSIILKSILVRSEFLNKSCKKFNHKIKEYCLVRMVGVTIATTSLSDVDIAVNVFLPESQQIVTLNSTPSQVDLKYGNTTLNTLSREITLYDEIFMKYLNYGQNLPLIKLALQNYQTI